MKREMTISVIMSIYNEKIAWVRKAVESILQQSFSDFEFIIISDNPNISQELETYLREITNKDQRIKIIWNETNLGLALCLNKGIEIAKGEYIARMDADDISEITRFEEELAFIKETNSDMVSTNRIIIDEEDRVLAYPNPFSEDPNLFLPFSTLIVHPTVLIKTNVARALNGYRPFPRSQDYDLWLRMVSEGYKISILDKRLLRYRIRTTSLSNNNRLQQFYINHYQKKLYYERLKTGTDSFSTDRLEYYLKTKHITEKKNRKCVKVMEMLDLAQIDIDKGLKLKGLTKILHAFIVYPEIVYLIIYNKIKKNMAKVSASTKNY